MNSAETLPKFVTLKTIEPPAAFFDLTLKLPTVSYNSFSISKSFAWSAYGEYIIENLKNNTNPKKNISIREVPYYTDDAYEYLGKYYEFEVGDSYLQL